MGPITSPAPTGQSTTQPFQNHLEIVMSNLVKEVHKSSEPSDYDSFLRWTWAGDAKRPPIYTTETAIIFGILVTSWTVRDEVQVL